MSFYQLGGRFAYRKSYSSKRNDVCVFTLYIYVNVTDVALKHFLLQLVWTVEVVSYLRDRLVKLLIEEVALSKTRKGKKEY